MHISPINMNKVNLYTNFKQKSNVTEPAKEVDLPQQVDAKGYVNVNFRAKTQVFDTFVKRINPEIYKVKALADIPYAKESGIAEKLKDILIDPLRKYRASRGGQNVDFPNGVILFGKPQTGKTMVANAIAKETQLPMYKLDLNEVVKFNQKEWKFESMENIEKIFDQLDKKFQKTGEPSLLHIENADCLFRELEKENVVMDFLNLLNNSRKKGVIPIIEPIKKLPSYVKKLLPQINSINFENPNFATRKAIIKDILAPRIKAKKLLKNEEAIDEIAGKTENMSPAKIRNLINEAAQGAFWDGGKNITKDGILDLI